MTSPTPPPQTSRFPTSGVYRPSVDASHHHRSSSLPRAQELGNAGKRFLSPEEKQASSSERKISLDSRPIHIRHPSSSRPSLEGGRPSLDVVEPPARTKSSNARPRPASIYLESNMDFLREKESNSRPALPERKPSYTPRTTEAAASPDPASEEETNIESNVDFLRSMEDSEAAKKDRRRSSGSNKKRSSLPSMSLSGTKNLLAGKFGDAFKRFEGNNPASQGPRTPSPLNELERRDLTPIAGSVATDGRSDDGHVLEDADDLSPEQRRELERRRLSMEEKRVANAAAEYRKRLEERGGAPMPKSIGGVSRATSIQNKVKNLLDEAQHSPPKRTAEGYGRFTENRPPSQSRQFEQPSSTESLPAGNVARKPIAQSIVHPRTVPVPENPPLNYPKPRSQPSPAALYKSSTGRPSAPPKPLHLNSVSTGGARPASPHTGSAASVIGSRPRVEARPDMTQQEKEDYIADFSKRFPSLSGIELVETEIQKDRDDSRKDFSGLRTKEV